MFSETGRPWEALAPDEGVLLPLRARESRGVRGPECGSGAANAARGRGRMCMSASA